MNDTITRTPRRLSGRACARTALVMGVALFGVSQTSAIAAAADPVPAPAPAISGPASGIEPGIENPESGTDAEARACTFYTRGYPVFKSGNAVVGRGGWRNVNCPASRAVVTVYMQQYYSDRVWRTVYTGRGTVPSLGTVTARVGCSSSAYTGWRSVIDVDLVGVADSPEKLVTPARNLYCRR